MPMFMERPELPRISTIAKAGAKIKPESAGVHCGAPAEIEALWNAENRLQEAINLSSLSPGESHAYAYAS